MAMSRILSQSLLTRSASFRSPTPAAISHHKRHRSSKSHRAQLIELDLDSPSSSSSQSDEVITVGIKKLEDAIHGMIVRRAAPDWLPFLPGYSYWVPPQRSSGIRHHTSAGAMMEVIGKLAASRKHTTTTTITRDFLSEDEHMASTSSKGWPSSNFFIQGASPMHPIPVVEMQVKIEDDEDNSDDTSNSENEEG